MREQKQKTEMVSEYSTAAPADVRRPQSQDLAAEIWDRQLRTASPPANPLYSQSPGLLGSLTQYDQEKRKQWAFAVSFQGLC